MLPKKKPIRKRGPNSRFIVKTPITTVSSSNSNVGTTNNGINTAINPVTRIPFLIRVATTILEALRARRAVDRDILPVLPKEYEPSEDSPVLPARENDPLLAALRTPSPERARTVTPTALRTLPLERAHTVTLTALRT
jgi:hypothetical protein